MPIPEHLLAAEYINLATFKKNGDAVSTPIWAAPVEGKLYAFSEAKAGKMKRLKNFSNVRICECTHRGESLGVWQDASAYIIDDPVEITTALEALQHKYGWKMRLTDLASKAVGRYAKRGYLRIEMP